MHEEIKAKARKALEEFIRSGMDSKEALKRVQNEYLDDVVDVMSDEMNSLKVGFITPARLKKMAIGDIDLSTNLYRHIDDVNANVLKTINEHAKALNNAQDLALKIFEGYDFKDDPLKVQKGLPKYLFDPLKELQAKQLKTPALKAAYMQLLEAQSDKELKKALKTAMYERNRFFANRIAQTELHRIHTHYKVKQILEDDGVEVVQIKLSATHPKVDICDYHANLDAYGLGKGCYPKHKAPLPPYHPFCRCIVSSRMDLSLSDAEPIPDDPELNLMRSFNESDQVNILGTKGIHTKWQQGGKVIDLVDRTRKPLYRTKYASEILGNAVVPDLNGDELLYPLSVTDKVPDLEKVQGIMWENYQQELSEWIALVVAPDYKARHEFKLLSLLPEFVFQHKLLQSFEVTEREIFVSDHQLRHAVRTFKAGKWAAFSNDEIANLPYLIQNARWFIDAQHEGSVLAVVDDIGTDAQVGKVAIAIKFKRDKRNPKRNVVVTTGKIESYNLKESVFVEIIE